MSSIKNVYKKIIDITENPKTLIRYHVLTIYTNENDTYKKIPKQFFFFQLVCKNCSTAAMKILIGQIPTYNRPIKKKIIIIISFKNILQYHLIDMYYT